MVGLVCANALPVEKRQRRPVELVLKAAADVIAQCYDVASPNRCRAAMDTKEGHSVALADGRRLCAFSGDGVNASPVIAASAARSVQPVEPIQVFLLVVCHLAGRRRGRVRAWLD